MSDALPQPEPPRDLKWGVLVGFAAATPKLPDLKDKSSPLNAVANNFLRNIQRINWMILAPSLVGDLTINIQRCFDLAEITLTGTMNTNYGGIDRLRSRHRRRAAAATPQTLVGNTNGFIRRLPRRTERRFPLTTLSASRLPCA
jgi:hypothetical protein